MTRAFRSAWRRLAVGTVPLLVLPLAGPAVPADRSESASGAARVAVRAARLVDGRGGAPIRDGIVLVRGERIEAIGSSLPIPEGVPVIDLGGATVLPVLIDPHTHLTGEVGIHWEEQFLRETPGGAALWGARNAADTLRAGFTTCRDMGPTWPYTDVDLRTAIDRGVVPGPRLQVAGNYVSATGGAGDARQFSIYVDVPVVRNLVDGADAVRHAVRTNFKHGADFIKILATGAVLPKGIPPGTQQYSDEELRAAVEEAARWGRPVAAHAHGTEGIHAALRAGVRTIDHGSMLDDDAVALLREKGAYFVPTLYVKQAILEEGRRLGIPASQVERERALIERGAESFRKALRAGLPNGFATDAGVFPHGRNAREFAVRVAPGEAPMASIASATRLAAEILEAGNPPTLSSTSITMGWWITAPPCPSGRDPPRAGAPVGTCPAGHGRDPGPGGGGMTDIRDVSGGESFEDTGEAPAHRRPIPGLDRIHEGALRVVEAMAEEAAGLGVEVTTLANGTRLLDAGVRAPGSLEAGRRYAEACLGGLGNVRIATRRLGRHAVPEARVAVRAPLAACMASQYAGWQIRHERFSGMGSGPARALAAAEPLFERYPLAARAERSVLLLETATLPDEEVAARIAGRCGLAPPALTLVAAATGTPVGSTQIAARSVETALHKLMELSFDLESVVAGRGSCPIAPPIADPLRAIGRTNDAMLYGAEVTLWVRAGVAAIRDVLDSIPSCSSEDYGRLFFDLFREHGDFYKIDPLLFSPARVTFVSAPERLTFSAGAINEALLLRSFGLGGAA